MTVGKSRLEEIAGWRRDFHQFPELLFDLERTSGIVAAKLREFGCDEIVTGIARTGVVGVLHGRNGAGKKVVGLRADMDALPIVEANAFGHISQTPGRMHACGHDGHTAMLLGAARELAERRDFDGTVVFIFQPAEEGGGGARVMIEDGLLERFGINEVYAIHNAPGLPVGHFGLRPGPTFAASDRFITTITGVGGHAGFPHHCVDPVIIASHIAVAFQTIVSRHVDPTDTAVISITTINAGSAFNVIPSSAKLTGTVRTFSPDVRDRISAQMKSIVEKTSEMFYATGDFQWLPGYPATINNPEKAEFAGAVAKRVASPEKVDEQYPKTMAAEDFSFMLEKRPGAIIWAGNGASAPLHHPSYDFDDEGIAHGVAFWVALVEQAMPVA